MSVLPSLFSDAVIGSDPDRGQVLGQAKRQSRAPVRILNAGIAEMRAIVMFLLCELLVELEEFGYALAFKINKTCFKINKFSNF